MKERLKKNWPSIKTGFKIMLQTFCVIVIFVFLILSFRGVIDCSNNVAYAYHDTNDIYNNIEECKTAIAEIKTQLANLDTVTQTALTALQTQLNTIQASISQLEISGGTTDLTSLQTQVDNIQVTLTQLASDNGFVSVPSGGVSVIVNDLATFLQADSILYLLCAIGLAIFLLLLRR